MCDVEIEPSGSFASKKIFSVFQLSGILLLSFQKYQCHFYMLNTFSDFSGDFSGDFP